MLDKLKQGLHSGKISCFNLYESRKGLSKDRFVLRLDGHLYFVERMGKGKSNSSPPKNKV